MGGRVVKKGEKVRYGCLRSGTCCSSGPNVSLTVCDICRIARYLGVGWRDLAGRYIYVVVADYFPIPVLRGVAGKCVFLARERGLPACSIYPARPMRCRLFPFVPVSPSVADKLEVSPICPGVGKGEEADPPWDVLEDYLEEVKFHYSSLFKLIFNEGREPVQALEELLDSVCSGQGACRLEA